MALPKVVISFDADGLLIDSSPSHLMAFNYLIGKYGLLPMDIEKYRQINTDYRLVYQDLGITDDMETLNKIYWPAFDVLVRELNPLLVENAREVLYFLSQNVFRLILITNQKKENIEFYDSYSNFLIYFNEAFYVNCLSSKYEVLQNIKDSHPDKEDIIFIFVSDTPDDLEAGQEAGWNVYGIAKYGFSSPDNLRKVIRPGNGALLQDIYELMEMFCEDNRKI